MARAATITRSKTRPRPLRAEPRPEVAGLTGVHVGYEVAGRRIEVLRGADLAVESGELVAIVGRSGSGKSTLLHVAGGMAAPDTGTVRIAGRDIAAMKVPARAAWRREHVGFVFQAFHLLAGLTVVENVALPRLLNGASRADAVGAAAAMIDAVGLTERAGHVPAELSGGEMQRVAIARALVGQPAVVLADEPTGNLDASSAALVLDVLIERARDADAACLLVTHDPAIAARADRVLTMEDGVLA